MIYLLGHVPFCPLSPTIPLPRLSCSCLQVVSSDDEDDADEIDEDAAEEEDDVKPAKAAAKGGRSRAPLRAVAAA